MFFFSRELLQNLIDIDLSNEIFAHRTARIIQVAGHTVRALRTSFVGEMGWELHIPWQSCIPVYNALWEEGLKFGLRQAGYRALYSLSSEKGSIMIYIFTITYRCLYLRVYRVKWYKNITLASSVR